MLRYVSGFHFLSNYHKDYLVQVKENQPKVHTKMKEVFHEVTKETSHDYDRRINKKRGAVEIREEYVKKWAAEYVREPLEIPDCLSLIRLDKEIRRQGERTLRVVHERCAAQPLDIGKTLGLNNFKKTCERTGLETGLLERVDDDGKHQIQCCRNKMEYQIDGAVNQHGTVYRSSVFEVKNTKEVC